MAEITIASYNKAVSPAFTGATATLKIWYDRQFLTSDDEIVLAGSVEYPNLEVACTVSGGGFTVTIPQFVIDSTIDGIPPNSRATAILFDADGIHRETVLANFRIPDVPTSTTWPALFIYNQGGLVTLPDEYYTKNEVNALLNVISVGGASVTSTELSAAAAGLSIRVDSVHSAVSALSQQNSVAHAALSSRVQSVFVMADATSIRITDLLINDLDDVSAPSPTDGQLLVWNSVAGQWQASTVAGGSGSVTSQELSIAAAGLSVRIDSVANAVSVISQAVSALSADHLSLQNRVSANSALASNLQSAIQANSAQMTSADNTISNAVSIVSQAVSVEIVNRISADNALSVRINTASNAVSIVSQALSVEIANRISADQVLSVGYGDAIANISVGALKGVSIASLTDQQTLVWNSVVGQWVNSTIAAGVGSVTSTEVSAVSAAAASADASLSVRIDTQSQSISVLSQQISALSQNLSANSVVLSNTRSAVQANSPQMTSADNAISNAVSIVSQAVSVEIVNRISADNALSVRIDTQSQSISVISQALSALSQNLSANSVVLSNTRSAVQANSAQMTSADNAISNAVSVVSAAVAVVSALVSTVASALSARIDTVSNALSAKKLTSLADVSGTPADGQVPQWNSAAAKFQFSTVAAGTGSVTSDEMSVAIAVETSNRISADNALSVRVNTVSQAVSALVLDALLNVSAPSPTDQQALIWNSAQAQWIASTVAGGSGSVTSTELSAASAAAASADATLSTRIDSAINAISVVSNAVSIVSVATANALSAISVLSQQVSVLSARVASNSAQMVSADNAISNAVSIVSQALSVTNATLSNLASSHSVLSQQVSVLSAYVNRAIGTEFDAGIASTASVVVNWSNGRAQKFSIVANTPFAAPTNMSAGGRYILRIVQDATGNRQPTWNATYVWPNSAIPTLGTANAVDILGFYCDGTNLYGSYNDQLSAFQVIANTISNNISVISAAAATVSNQLSNTQSAANVLSNQLSNLQSVTSVLSGQLSNLQSVANSLSAQLQTQVLIVSNTQSNATSTLAKISGLVMSLSAGETWELGGMILVSTSVAAAGLRLGVSGGVFSTPRFITFSRLSTGQSAGMLGGGGLMAVSGTSTYLSAANIGGVLNGIRVQGVFNVASAGTFRLVYAAMTSAAASPVHIMPGSYMRAIRLK